jgi:colanic acid/amylovoran biosynthesis glycosyltransferase
MNTSLAIFSEHIGEFNHSYIRRHINGLLPGRTVLVTSGRKRSPVTYWEVECPTLTMSRIKPNAKIGSLTRKVGGDFDQDLVIRFTRRFFKEHRVKVMIGEFLDLSLPWIEIAQELGIRFFGHAHGEDVSANLRNPYWQTEYRKYNQSEGIITINQVSRSRLLDLGIDHKKVHVVPCGVDVPDNPRDRKNNSQVKCLAVGRMVSKKAPILTLDAFRRAAELYPRLELDFIGSGELLSAAEQFITAFGLGDKVRLHGEQPHDVVMQYMNAADIFIQHSRVCPATGDEEGLPVAILEAMANSVPVVSTRHAGILEAIIDGVTGYLTQEGDSLAMSEKIVALASDSRKRCNMGKEGWRRVKESFSWETEREKLLGILAL